MKLKSLLSSVVCAALACATLAVPHAAPAQSISNLYAVGVSGSPGASPALAGTALYAHQISADSAPGMYAFTVMDILPASAKPFTVTTNVGAGIAQKIATIDGLPVLIPTTAGISLTGTNTGWAWTTGAAVPFRAKAGSNWYLVPSVRVLKSSVGGGGYQPIFGLLIGWGS